MRHGDEAVHLHGVPAGQAHVGRTPRREARDVSACIGWEAEPRCPVNGAFHCCKLEDGHNDRQHVCECGETTAPNTARRLPAAPHGTIAGAQAHRRRGEKPCRACQIEVNRYEARRRPSRSKRGAS